MHPSKNEKIHDRCGVQSTRPSLKRSVHLEIKTAKKNADPPHQRARARPLNPTRFEMPTTTRRLLRHSFPHTANRPTNANRRLRAARFRVP